MRTYQAYVFAIGIPVWVDRINWSTQTGILNGLALRTSIFIQSVIIKALENARKKSRERKNLKDKHIF